MWEEDEDNNPYGSFHRRESNTSDPHPTSPTARMYLCLFFYNNPTLNLCLEFGFNAPHTPPSNLSSPQNESPDFIPHPADLSDVDYDDERAGGERVEPRKGGYDSRIEQILHENPDLDILITQAGKNTESGGSYIAYTIRTGV